MKKRILVVIMCLVCVASYGQRRKKKSTKKRAAVTHQVPASTDNTTATSAPPVDTARKVAAAPAKPFDRPLDGYYKKDNITNAKVTPYPNIRENDVLYAKRIWREIDIREKMNAYLASPKMRLIDVIMTAVANGELTAYDATPTPKDIDGDSFSTPLSPGDAKRKMVDSSLVNQLDKDGNIVSTKLVAGELDADSVVKFRIKEDWIFDKQRSVFEPRIIGIAPMMKVKVGATNEYQPAFWIYFPDARPIFATKEAVSRNNDATGLSLDDVFNKRLFSSYIVKESNDKDNRIKDYATGIDRLYESERIKKDLMDWELNLWQY